MHGAFVGATTPDGGVKTVGPQHNSRGRQRSYGGRRDDFLGRQDAFRGQLCTLSKRHDDSEGGIIFSEGDFILLKGGVMNTGRHDAFRGGVMLFWDGFLDCAIKV